MDKLESEPQRIAWERDAAQMFDNFDGWLGAQEPEFGGRIGLQIDALPEDERGWERKKLAAVHLMAADTGIPPNELYENWSPLSNGYAQWRGGEWLSALDDDAGLLVKVGHDLTRRGEEQRLLMGPEEEMPRPGKVGFWSGLFGGDRLDRTGV